VKVISLVAQIPNHPKVGLRVQIATKKVMQVLTCLVALLCIGLLLLFEFLVELAWRWMVDRRQVVRLLKVLDFFYLLIVSTADSIDVCRQNLVQIANGRVKHDSERCVISFHQVVSEHCDLAAFEIVDHLHLTVRKVSHLVSNLRPFLLAIQAVRHLDIHERQSLLQSNHSKLTVSKEGEGSFCLASIIDIGA